VQDVPSAPPTVEALATDVVVVVVVVTHAPLFSPDVIV